MPIQEVANFVGGVAYGTDPNLVRSLLRDEPVGYLLSPLRGCF